MSEVEYVIKPLKNLKNATVFDCETSGLRFEADKVHVLSFKMKGKSIASIPGNNYERMRSFFKWHIDNEVPVVAHNGIGYDIPVLEELLEIDLSHLMVIDTLPISWYLNVNRVSHGLGTFHEDYGIEKPAIDDWENLTYEEYEFRCSSDVAINVALWEDLLSRLEWMYGYVKEEVDKPEFGGVRMSPDEVMAIDQMKGKSVEGYICNCLDYLMSIMFTYRVQEDYGLTLDVDSIEDSLKELHGKVEAIKIELEKAMPLIPKYTKKNKPKVMFKKSGDLSSAGKSWEEVKKQYQDKTVDNNGTRLVLIGKDETVLSNEFGEEFSRPVDDIEQFMVFKEYDAPNANSPQQVKDMLFLHGWVPDVYKDVKDKAAEALYRKQMDAWREIKGRKPPRPEKPEVRQVEQVAVKGDDGGKELTQSVLDLAEKVPAIKLYADYNLFRHRVGVLEGFLKNRDCRGKLVAGLGGLTSTIRQKHRGAVNLPGVMAAYGKNIRGAIIADNEDEVLLGSDLSSLESVLGFHFMLPLDPDYVKEMLAPDWDSHLATALAAGLINKKEFDDYKNGTKPDHVTTARKQAKIANYSAQYGAGGETIAKGAGIPSSLGHQLHSGYWAKNWSIKEIAAAQVVLNFKEKDGYDYFGYNKMFPTWLINPINGIAYELRKDGDRFSALIQGLGSYVQNRWLQEIFLEQKRRFGKVKCQANFHDEYVMSLKGSEKAQEIMLDITKQALVRVNKNLNLRKSVECDIQFGKRYADIH